jgi:V8-like Glu-specific endopeptidase
MTKMLSVATPRRVWFLGSVALTLTLSACGEMPTDGAAGDDDIALQTSEIQNGTRYSGSSWGWGAVKVETWWPDMKIWYPCSGQVVSRQTILTAAHCVGVTVSGANPGYQNVRAWMQTDHGVVQVLNAWSQVRYRPEFDGTNGKYDVGLITAPSVSLLKNVAPRDAAYLAKTLPSDFSMVAVGYGYMDDTTFDGLGRYATITPKYKSDIKQYFYQAADETKPQMCDGDSGGPLKKGGVNTTHGVVAGGDGSSGRCHLNAYWATTKDNIDWLRGKIAGTCTETSEAYACW